MKCIILAGGFGTRLRSVIGDDLPKCMAPVMGRPMVDLIIKNLRKQNITDITLALHYKAEQFVHYFGDKVKYKIEDEPLGTGGAIKNCIDGNDPILVVNGDTILHMDYMDMLLHHVAPLSIAQTPDGISAGVYILNPDIFDGYDSAFSFEKDVIPNVTYVTYPVSWFTDFGTPETYNKVCKEWV